MVSSAHVNAQLLRESCVGEHGTVFGRKWQRVITLRVVEVLGSACKSG